MTVLIFRYNTEENIGGINEFTESPFGKDKSWIRRNEPSSFLGTKPNSEHIKFWNGGLSKGPLTLPFWITFASFSATASGLSLALLWMGGTSSLAFSMQELILNPWENPDINLSFRSELYPWRKWINLFTLTGVVSSVTYSKPFFTCEWCMLFETLWAQVLKSAWTVGTFPCSTKGPADTLRKMGLIAGPFSERENYLPACSLFLNSCYLNFGWASTDHKRLCAINHR